MNVKELMYSWALPGRVGELRQFTLRIPFDTYAKLHALKQVFPGQSVNDFISDILNESLREIISSLQTDEQLSSAYQQAIEDGLDPDELPPSQRSCFDVAYREALRGSVRNRVEEEENVE